MIDLDSESIPQQSSEIDWLEGVEKLTTKTLNKWTEVRLIGGVFGIATHTIKWISTKDGTEKSWTKLCPRLNPDTCRLDRMENGKLVACPECDREGGSAVKMRWLLNVIVREDQRHNHPNPIKVLELPETTMIKEIQGRKTLNKVGDTSYSPAHAQYGFDLHIMFDGKAKGPAMWQFQTAPGAGRTPLTAVEQSYTLYNLAKLYKERGLVAADPAALKGFLQRVRLLAASPAASGTQMPAASAPTFMEDTGTLPVWQQPVTNAPADFTTTATNPFGSAMPAMSAPSFAAPAMTAPAPDTSSRFGALPVVTQEAPAQPQQAPVNVAGATASGHPECFGNTEVMGDAKCLRCPSKVACFKTAD